MAEPVRARRLTDQEGQRLQQIVRRGKHGSIRVRRAMIIMGSASGTPVPAIARLATTWLWCEAAALRRTAGARAPVLALRPRLPAQPAPPLVPGGVPEQASAVRQPPADWEPAQ